MLKMQVAFENNIFQDYIAWLDDEPKTFEKLCAAIKGIRHGVLKGKCIPQKSGNGSITYCLKIDDKNDLVYSIYKNVLEIKSCKGHYDD